MTSLEWLYSLGLYKAGGLGPKLRWLKLYGDCKAQWADMLKLYGDCKAQ